MIEGVDVALDQQRWLTRLDRAVVSARLRYAWWRRHESGTKCPHSRLDFDQRERLWAAIKRYFILSSSRRYSNSLPCALGRRKVVGAPSPSLSVAGLIPSLAHCW